MTAIIASYKEPKYWNFFYQQGFYTPNLKDPVEINQSEQLVDISTFSRTIDMRLNPSEAFEVLNRHKNIHCPEFITISSIQKRFFMEITLYNPTPLHILSPRIHGILEHAKHNVHDCVRIQGKGK